MTFRFKAATDHARRTPQLAQQASRRLSLLAYAGDALVAPEAAAAAAVAASRSLSSLSASSSSAAATTTLRSRAGGRMQRDALPGAYAPIPLVTDRNRGGGEGLCSYASSAVNARGCWNGGRQVRRGLATSPAAAAAALDAVPDGGVAQQEAGGVVRDGTLALSGEDDGRRTALSTPEAMGAPLSAASPDASSGFLIDFQKRLRKSAQARDGKQALALLAGMREAGVVPTAKCYTSAINALRGQWQEALALLKEVSTVGGGVTPNAYHYTSAMKACGSAGQWEQIPRLRSEMESLGIVPNVPYYHWAINVANDEHGSSSSSSGEREGSGPQRGWGAVKNIVADMSEKGVVPNVYTFTKVWVARDRFLRRGGSVKDAGRDSEAGGDDAASAIVQGVDHELEEVLATLRGIQGAPQPTIVSAYTTLKPMSGSSSPQKESAESHTTASKQQQRGQQRRRQQKALASEDDGDIVEGGDKDAGEETAVKGRAKGKGKGKGKGKTEEDVVRTAAGAKLNRETCSRDLRRFAMLGQGNEAASLVARMQKEGIPPSIRNYTSAINACKNGSHIQWKTALALLRGMPEKDSPPNAFHYTSAMQACGNAHQWEQIPVLLSEMENRGILPNRSFYNWSIRVASLPTTGRAARAVMARGSGWKVRREEADGDESNSGADSSSSSSSSNGGGGDRSSKSPYFGWEAATDLLRCMSAQGVFPDSATYTLVMSACRRDGQPERSLEVLREMQELAAAAATAAESRAEGTDEGEDEGTALTATPAGDAHADGASSVEGDVTTVGVETDSPTMSHAETSATAAGFVSDGEIHSSGSNDSADDDVSPAAAAAATPDSSLTSSRPRRRRRRRRERPKALRDPVVPNVIHYSAVMAAFAEQAGGWQRALALIQEMEAAGVDPNTYTYSSAIEACGRDGRWAEALAVFRRMQRKGVPPDQVSFTAVIEACKKGEQWALAVALLREMERTPLPGRPGENMPPTVEAYTSALSACGNAGQWEMAVGLLREVVDGRADATGASGGVLGGVGGVDEPAVEAVELERSIGVAEVDASVGGDVDGGVGIGGGDDDGGSGGGFTGVNDDDEDEDESEGEDAEDAVDGTGPQGLSLPPVRPLAPDVFLYNAAIEACGNAGQWKRALELLSEISQIGLLPSVVSYNSAISACAGADQWEKAVALMDEMRVLGLRPVANTYVPVMEACIRAGQTDLAISLRKERDAELKRVQRQPEFKSEKRAYQRRQRQQQGRRKRMDVFGGSGISI